VLIRCYKAGGFVITGMISHAWRTFGNRCESISRLTELIHRATREHLDRDVVIFNGKDSRFENRPRPRKT